MSPRSAPWTALAVLLSACQPMQAEVSREPAGTALRLAREHRRAVPAARLELAPLVRALAHECQYRDRVHQVRVELGGPLEAALGRLFLEALATREDPGAPTLLVRVTEALAESTLEQPEASARVELTVEAGGGVAALASARLVGTGRVPLGRVWTPQVPVIVEEAFRRALAEVQLRFVRFLAELPLEAAPVAAPPPGAAPRANPPLEGAISDAEALLAIGDLASAEEALTLAIQRAPTDPRAFQRRGAVRLALGQLDPALADCFRAIELDPGSAPAYVTRARVYAARGCPTEARADCERALALPHDELLGAAASRLLGSLGRER